MVGNNFKKRREEKRKEEMGSITVGGVLSSSGVVIMRCGFTISSVGYFE